MSQLGSLNWRAGDSELTADLQKAPLLPRQPPAGSVAVVGGGDAAAAAAVGDDEDAAAAATVKAAVSCVARPTD